MLADVGTSMHAAEPDYSEAAPRARKPPWARGPADSPAPRPAARPARPPTPEAAVSQSTDLASIKARIQSALAGGIHERNEIVCFVSNAFGKSKISRERIVDVLRKSQRVAEPPWWQRGESYYLVGDGQEEELGRSPAVRAPAAAPKAAPPSVSSADDKQGLLDAAHGRGTSAPSAEACDTPGWDVCGQFGCTKPWRHKGACEIPLAAGRRRGHALHAPIGEPVAPQVAAPQSAGA